MDTDAMTYAELVEWMGQYRGCYLRPDEVLKIVRARLGLRGRGGPDGSAA